MLVPLELTAAASAADASIHNKILESRASTFGITTLIVSNEEVNDMKIS